MKLIPDEAKNEKSDFNFTAETIALLPKLKHIGTATCDFQSEPLFYKNGEPSVFTDWEMDVIKQLKKKKSGEREKEMAQFPRFLANKELYVKRSRELGQNMFRFSFDCGRLCPREGEFNSKLMAEYVRMLGLIKTYGQEPMVAMYHWPMPRYLLKLDKRGNISSGAWENRDVLQHFRFYAENVVNFLTDKDKVENALSEGGFGKDKVEQLLSEGLCDYFLTINEPINLILPTYLLGIYPPYKKGRIDIVKKVIKRAVEVHDIMRSQIKTGGMITLYGEPKVGVAHNWTYFDGWLGGAAHWLVNEALAECFERNGAHTDFFGLQYYFRLTIPTLSRKGRIYGDNPFFGDIYPQGIYDVLKKIHLKWRKDIFITEFGFSDDSGLRQPYWILETVRYVLKALKNQIPVKGVLLWTLVNNFEWNLGMSQKFGLFSEAELKKPLIYGGKIKAWEVWQAVAKVAANPSPEAIRELQNMYVIAKKQFKDTVTSS